MEQAKRCSSFDLELETSLDEITDKASAPDTTMRAESSVSLERLRGRWYVAENGGTTIDGGLRSRCEAGDAGREGMEPLSTWGLGVEFSFRLDLRYL
jgi:hypothetical protein